MLDMTEKLSRGSGTDADGTRSESDDIRRALRCRIYPTGELADYKYVVICSNFVGRWILSRHRDRQTWETQGGHIEAGETPLEAALRELYEESGITDADVRPVCDYYGYDPNGSANGMVFLAEVRSVGELPDSEMKEIRVFDVLPDELTYPGVTPVLIGEAAKAMAGNNPLTDLSKT